jgi:hypothetical protein
MHVWRIFYTLRPLLHTSVDRVYADEARAARRQGHGQGQGQRGAVRAQLGAKQADSPLVDPEGDTTASFPSAASTISRLTQALTARTHVLAALQEHLRRAPATAPSTPFPLSVLATLIIRTHTAPLLLPSLLPASAPALALRHRYTQLLTTHTPVIDSPVAGTLIDDTITLSACGIKTMSSAHLGDAILSEANMPRLRHQQSIVDAHIHNKHSDAAKASGDLLSDPSHPLHRSSLASLAKEPLHVFSLLRREMLRSTTAAAAADAHRERLVPVAEEPAMDVRVGVDYDVCVCDAPVMMMNPVSAMKKM